MNQNKPNLSSPQDSSEYSDLPATGEIPPAPQRNSYGMILKSSAIIGGSTMITILIGIVRTKFMALLLGPSGIGLMGIYTSITELSQNIIGVGVSTSGVRQIAEAVGSEDSVKIAKTAQVLRRTSLFLGLLGTALLFGFAPLVSTLTFNNSEHTNDIRLISLAVFFSLVSGGQSALIQGMRRIADLAKMGIFSALLGTFFSFIAVYYLGQAGVALALVLIAAMSLTVSFRYRLKIKIPPQSMSRSEIAEEQSALLKLGFAFMASGLLMTGTAYIIRMLIAREAGFEAAGLYQSAWALGGMYIGIILQAMGADFYPRLTAVAQNNIECNRLVNEQAHVGMLLAAPGIMATLTFAPLVIELFYSAKFQGAVEILRWLCLGMTLRVVSWPMGFIIVAKGVQNILILSELGWAVVYLALAWICIQAFQLNGAGIAFFGSYIFHVVMVYAIVIRLSRFSWSDHNKETGFVVGALITTVFCSYYVLPPLPAFGIGTISVLLSGLYSIQILVNLVSIERIPRTVLRVMKICRLIPQQQTNPLAPPISEMSKKSVSFNDAPRSGKQLIYLFIIGVSAVLWAYGTHEIFMPTLSDISDILPNKRMSEFIGIR